MIKNIINDLKHLSRRWKQFLMMMTDLFLLPFSLWIAFSLRVSSPWPIEYMVVNWWIFILTTVISIPLFIHYGLYRWVLKYMGYQVIVATLKAITISSLTIGTIVMLLRDTQLPRSTVIIFWFVAILVIIGSRYLLKSALYFTEPLKKPVGIYGAGKAGAQLVDNLRQSSDYIPAAMFDDSPAKWGTVVNSLYVYSSEEMGEVLKPKGIKLVLIAVINLTPRELQDILNKISKYPVEVRIISSIENLIRGKINLNHIKKVEVEDLLGRNPVEPRLSLLQKNIKDKNIMVTGAGGSIGSELCKQILALHPKKLILYDNSEFALYRIHLELNMHTSEIDIYPILASITDQLKLIDILQIHKINTVFHAAAYKHVPLVEINPLEGIRNNILGTYACVKASLEAEVNNFILISTDKAVRPTNVMGATKRFSELILQGADKLTKKTCFTMVRFGNVLDSAGSVVPLFREQIQNGGPVTVTHPDVTRYFMSIPEAVQLVIQAGAMAKGGDVFVLEMGTPVKIIDLAIKMIHLSGYNPLTNSSPNGDIEIKITGLRPGEKLNEELIIGNHIYSTDHPHILKARESFFTWKEIEEGTYKIKSACESLDINFAREILTSYVANWRSNDDIVQLSKPDLTPNLKAEQEFAES